MKRILAILVLSILAITIIYQCKNEDSSVLNFSGQKYYSQTTDEIDSHLVAFAKNIAKAERIPEFRNFIKRQAEKLIGQEQIVLYLQVVDSVIYGTTTFAQLMDKISDTFGYNYSYNYYRTELPDMLPRLTITVYTGGEYVDIENWTYTEPIQVLPWTENLKAINEAYGTSYDQYFNEYSVSNFDDPDSSMLVIEDNNSLWLVDESYRIIGFGQVTSSDTFFQYHLFELTDTIEHYLEYPHELPDSIKSWFHFQQVGILVKLC
jgi:hypothetical protein